MFWLRVISRWLRVSVPEPAFLAPTSLDEVLLLLDAYSDEVSLIAGGAVLTIALKMKMVESEYLLSLANIPELQVLKEQADGSLCIGSQVTHRQIELSPLCNEKFPLLSKTYGKVASVRLRNQATVGGNLATADYASDPPSALIAMNARVLLKSLQGERELPMQDFVLGHYYTALEENELLTQVIVPKPHPNAKSTYLKYKSRSSEDRPCASVAAVLTVDDAGKCEQLRVVVGAAAEAPHIDEAALHLALGEPLTPALIKEIAQRYQAGLKPMDDLRGSAWYRREVSGTLIKRALVELSGVSA